MGAVGDGGAIELDDWGWSWVSWFSIDGYHAGPVGCFGGVGSGVASGDFGLVEVGAGRLGPLWGG